METNIFREGGKIAFAFACLRECNARRRRGDVARGARTIVRWESMTLA